EPDSVEIPEFVPLQEIESAVDLPIRGYYILCPHCTRELRINRKFVGKRVTCKQCTGDFVLNFGEGAGKIEKVGVYGYCPHCSDRLGMPAKCLGIKVACKSCTGRLMAHE